MKASKNNNWQPKGGFLYELVKGEVDALIPDGCQYSYGGPEEEKGVQMNDRVQGARSGIGKKTSVV
jgi:hypothetical protein